MTTKITATYNDLLTYEDNGLGLYATPTSSGKLTGHYWVSSPKWAEDKCVATPGDFLEAAGYDSFCRDSEYLESCGDETYDLEVE